MLLGHTGRCFDIRVDDSGEYALSASEDGTSRVFHFRSRACKTTLLHNREAEVLRAAFFPHSSSHRVVTCGSDGRAVIWADHDGDFSFKQTALLAHEAEQIYSCELIPNHESSLLTAADECLYIWDVEKRIDAPLTRVSMSCASSSQPFGGLRNPENKAFIFDSKFAPSNAVCGLEGNAIATALSDGERPLRLDTFTFYGRHGADFGPTECQQNRIFVQFWYFYL